MTDSGTAIRKSYFNVLNGAISYDSSLIPIVDEKLDVNITEHDIYVLMTSQASNDVSNKSNWAEEVNITMQIVNQRLATNTKEIVENVSNQIQTLLFPSRLTNSLSIDTPFKLTLVKKVSEDYNPLQKNERGFLISKVLIFKNRITQ